jgi:hypothetical protein
MHREMFIAKLTDVQQTVEQQHFSYTNESKAKLTVEIISGLFYQPILE